VAGPIAAAGATTNPTRYGALTMGAEQFTGLYTQRSPYRDAATAYLVKKFYQGSRFDSIWDGTNREITAALTDKRRPGSVVYNSNAFPAVQSFFSWKYVQNGTEIVRVVADTTTNIYDATAGQQSIIAVKAAGAGKARFLNLGPVLYFGDGVEQKKILSSSKVWQASTLYNVGDLIIDSNGNAEVVQATGTANISQVQVVRSKLGLPLGPFHYFIAVTFSSTVNWPAGTPVTFTGLTSYTALNNQTLNVYVNNTYLSPAPNLAYFPAIISTLYGPAADTGSATSTGSSSGSGLSGSTMPFWLGIGATTTDGALTWLNFGPPYYDWQTAAPTVAPVVTPNPANRQWRPSAQLSLWYSIIDSNGNVQAVLNSAAGTYITGATPPQFLSGLGNLTTDGDCVWVCGGRPGARLNTTSYAAFATILDLNGNLQMVTNGGGGNSGASPPATWATTVGATTTDGALTWTCLGAGTVLVSAPVSYSYSFHSIDGGVSTAAPLTPLNHTGTIIGANGAYTAAVSGPGSDDPQVDQIWIWRTPQGQSTPLLLAQIPNPGASTNWNFIDTLPDSALNPFISAPQANSGDPPPLGFTGPVYHLQRIWGFVGDTVYYSGGPDTITGNGNTAFPPLNSFTYQAVVIKLLPITVQNGGMLVFTTSGIEIILGTGTGNNPFYSTTYCRKINLASYDALDVMGTEIFLMESNLKVSSIRVEYPFDPQSGYTEVGFPIGDQFQKMTTAGFNFQIFTAASTFLSWHVQSSGETAMYVADGGVGWFRMSALMPPESGLVWSPYAAIGGGTSAVQSVETAPGVFDLLIGPPSGTTKAILKRDTSGTVFTDWSSPTPFTYPAWDAKGVNILCPTGQWAEVAHISAKSSAVGARPVVSVLMGEIAPSTERPWNVLEITSTDPPHTPPSKSVFSDRYALAQNGVADTGDCILTKFDYGSQAYGDQLLDWGIYASTDDERKEEVQK
jgi:hypothetical protein